MFLLVAIVIWIAGILYLRQLTWIENRWYQWVIGIFIMIGGLPFLYGAIFG